jgi:hypothetical protein
MNETIYHIYAKGQCIYHSLSKEKFEETWEMLHRMVDLIDVRLTKEDFSYEELTINKEAILNSSH